MDHINDADSPQSARLKLWTRDSSVLLGIFVSTVILVVYFWWPLAEAMLRRFDWGGAWWVSMDWLLIGIFTFMSMAIIARANIKTDALMIFVGVCGGLAIEAWGTQTNLWHYYTSERPPLWIIPAWPIANLCIDRITRAIDYLIKKGIEKHTGVKNTALHRGPKADAARITALFKATYWIIFVTFMILMVAFVAPTFDKSFTIISLLLCLIITLTPTDYRRATLTFIAGTGLGYFLELWGTTRHCWTYYTLETPPLFAVLAHGLAAVAFWRAGLLLKRKRRSF